MKTNTPPTLDEAMAIWAIILARQGHRDNVDIQQVATDPLARTTLALTIACRECWEHPRGVEAMLVVAASLSNQLYAGLAQEMVKSAIDRCLDTKKNEGDFATQCAEILRTLIERHGQRKWHSSQKTTGDRYASLTHVLTTRITQKCNKWSTGEDIEHMKFLGGLLAAAMVGGGVDINAAFMHVDDQQKKKRYWSGLDLACHLEDHFENGEVAIEMWLDAGVLFEKQIKRGRPEDNSLALMNAHPRVRAWRLEQHVVHCDDSEITARARAL